MAFIEAVEVEFELLDLVTSIRERQFRIAYVDCAAFQDRPWEIPSQIGYALTTDNAPYHEEKTANVTRWLDDLISLAYTSPGLVIVLDNGYLLFEHHRKMLTELIEAFLVQFHHWLEQKVPCHLCIQMEPSPLVAKLFASQV